IDSDSNKFGGSITTWHHAICAAMRKPNIFLRAVGAAADELGPELAQLEVIANATRAGKVKQVVWRHATRPRCLVEFADGFLLVTTVGGTQSVVRGTLDEVIASVPDEDLQDVVDTAHASGLALARDARTEQAAAKAAAAAGPLRT